MRDGRSIATQRRPRSTARELGQIGYADAFTPAARDSKRRGNKERLLDGTERTTLHEYTLYNLFVHFRHVQPVLFVVLDEDFASRRIHKNQLLLALLPVCSDMQDAQMLVTATCTRAVRYECQDEVDLLY
ncbi:hypothetical protein RJ55_02611 [Drechmeria coniospora]|nr:hypothetical protein RJ55_02611 [Drechmeria coniospora]